MAATRLMSALIELTAALWMLRLGRVEKALQVNGLLGLVGPAILVLTTAIGLAGMADQAPPGRLVLVAAGVALIILGTR